MEAKEILIEPLLERAQEYYKTSFELLKLQSLDKTADAASSLASRLLLTTVLTIFVLTLNIGIALWIGELLGKNYYGFFLVASFYGLIGIIFYFTHPFIKRRINNSIISQLLN